MCIDATSCRRTKPRSALSLALLLVTVAASGAESPEAAALFKAYIDATGGRAAHERVTNRVTRAEVSLPALSISSSTTIYQAKPDRQYVVQESAATGRIEAGTDGSVVWQNSALTGPQIKQGAERAFLLHSGRLDRWIDWTNSFEAFDRPAATELNNRPCYQVTATPRDGLAPMTLWFDRESRLLVKVAAELENAMGSIHVESHLEDYRDVDGIHIPFRTRTVIPTAGREIVTVIQACAQNVELPPDRFALPRAIEALVQKGKP